MIIRRTNNFDTHRTWQDYGLPERLPTSPAPPKLPPADGPEAAHRRIVATLSSGDRAPRFVRDDGRPDRDFGLVPTPAELDDVHVTKSLVDHLVYRRSADRHYQREEFAEFILPTLRNPAEVWRLARRGECNPISLAAYEGGTYGIVVVRKDKYGWVAWTFYPGKVINNKRKGRLLYRREA